MDKNKGKTKRRKIKIRLADPNIPDSYICEIIDSSLENEEDPKFKNHLELQETLKSVNNIKPKNYFEVLMSKDNKNININSDKESEKIQNATKAEREAEKQSFITKKQKYRQKNKNTELHLNNEIEKEECKINLSDKNLVQVHIDNVPEENFVAVSGELKFSKDVKNFGITSNKVLTTCESFSKRKPANILNYFSKIETVTSEKTPRKMKKKRHEEINCIKDSLQVCHTVEKLKLANDKDLEGPDKIGTRETLNGLNKENIKLAPLFTKKEKKVFDVDAQKARTEFLQKGLPFAQKKCKMNGKDIQEYETFPIVSHIQQKNDKVYWSNRNISLPFFRVTNNEECTWKNYKKFTCNVNQQPKCFLSFFHNLVKSRIEFSKETLKKVKYEYINLNLDLLIDGFKQKRDKFMKYTKQFDNSKPSNCIQSVLQTDFGSEIYNTLWLEKYKPTSNEILGNMNVVKKLKKWLESWKSFDIELKSLAKSNHEANSSKRNRKSCGTDDDYDSDIIKSDEESYDLKSPCNVCILSGPSGCGKTTLVYALANELEFNVLEVNASSKRTGKIVLSDLQEATQSHKFHHVSSPAPETNKTKHKNKKNRKQKKNNKIQNKIKIQDHANDCKISLILIEDADIVFEEHDEGFFSAVASLVQTSKRPLIFLTNDSSCVNLDTFKTEQCLILEMERPSYSISCAILDLVSLLEGISVEKETLKFFVCQNRFDLRKCLLELQFWIQSDEETVNVLQPMDLGHLWWGLSKFLYHQEIMHFERKRVPKRKRFSDLFDSSDDEEIATKKFKLTSSNQKNSFRNVDKPPSKNNSLLYSYFNILDLVSTLDAFRLSNSQEPIPITEYKPKDSLSLEENLEDVSWAQTNLAENIVGDLIKTSAGVFAKKVNVEKKLNFISPSWEEIRWRKLQEKADEELLGLIPLCNKRDKRSIYLDYLPILRNICRHEENRLTVNSKRKNRFYHYLSNLGIELTEENLSTNCEVFGN